MKEQHERSNTNMNAVCNVEPNAAQYERQSEHDNEANATWRTLR